MLLKKGVERAKGGDLSDLEAMLVAQAGALNSIFNSFARAARANMDEHVIATDTYMRIGLKAQSQCRATVETLAEIKHPRQVSFVHQANIANGPQQVNNGGAVLPEASRAGEIQNPPNELSGNTDELLPDARASQASSRIDSKVEALGEVHGTTVPHR